MNMGTLDGIECPYCGEHDEFIISATSLFNVRDDGTGDHQDVEWDDDSYIQCTDCKNEGTVREFSV